MSSIVPLSFPASFSPALRMADSFSVEASRRGPASRGRSGLARSASSGTSTSYQAASSSTTPPATATGTPASNDSPGPTASISTVSTVSTASTAPHDGPSPQRSGTHRSSHHRPHAHQRPGAGGFLLQGPLDGPAARSRRDKAANRTADSMASLPSAEHAASPDLDAAQIVNMALNLRESRRLPARRSVSSYQVPPRLAPLPDSSVGGSLRHQLQQQRRVSRNLSPRPDRDSIPAISVSASAENQTPFDTFQETSYRYHPSQSTLARAQKARNHLELLAQHRRLLTLLPPLTPPPPASSGQGSSGSNTNNTNNTNSNNNNNNSSSNNNNYRPYNPLQYIRNRKVRARERKAINGQAQGFGYVLKTTQWVDEVERQAGRAADEGRSPDGGMLLPPFASADEAAQHSSSGPASRMNTAAGTRAKPKRPPVDWIIDPADMIADVYWLEQDDNKRLVEDRHWHRVFPQDDDTYRPLSGRTDESSLGVDLPEKMDLALDEADMHGGPPGAKPGVPLLPSPSHEPEVGSARERARQKLRELKGLHQRHNNSVHGDLFLAQHGSPFTESSDSESDRRRQANRLRSDTVTATGAEMLRRQMVDRLAQEQRERDEGSSSLSPLPSHSRRTSEVDMAAATGRASLEVPGGGRPLLVDYDSSQPASPEMRPISREGLGFVPALGGDLSPVPSRTASPPRHRFSKVRSMFRDHSREHGGGMEETVREEESETTMLGPNDAAGETSETPLADLTPTTTAEAVPTIEPSPTGLRAFLRGGPRIDAAIRNGMSKMSGMLWRREAADTTAEGLSSCTSSSDEESEAEAEALSRGRSRSKAGSRLLSRSPSQAGMGADGAGAEKEKPGTKHYLDIMPRFARSESSTSIAGGGDQGHQLLQVPSASTADAISRPASQQSARFERLKPPRIDIQAASPSDSVADQLQLLGMDEQQGWHESDQSESESRSRPDGGVGVGEWSETQTRQRAVSSSGRSPLCRRELARVRASLLSSAVVANELSRRAKQRRVLTEDGCAVKTMEGSQQAEEAISQQPKTPSSIVVARGSDGTVLTWADVAAFGCSEAAATELARRPVAPMELYPLAAQVMGAAVQRSGQAWQETAEVFGGTRAEALRRRADELRTRVAIGLSGLASQAADEADEVSRELADVRRLQVKRLDDAIDAMLRRRRRRFRWVRRAGWLTVEWVLVGFMWYVWFVVMLARVVLGAFRGVAVGIRWLLWL